MDQFIGALKLGAEVAVDLILHRPVTNSNEPRLILHHLKATNALEGLIWALEAWMDMFCLQWLVSQLMDATMKPMDGEDELPTSIHRCGVFLVS